MRDNNRRMFVPGCVIGLLVASMVAAEGPAEYEIVWHTIDAGGGTSQGGEYSLSGTIGQADAGWSAGDGYEILGGFWPGGPLCVVGFDDFAGFADYWWLRDSGADLNEDTQVNFIDLAWFTDYWLSYCPYAWPFR